MVDVWLLLGGFALFHGRKILDNSVFKYLNVSVYLSHLWLASRRNGKRFLRSNKMEECGIFEVKFHLRRTKQTAWCSPACCPTTLITTTHKPTQCSLKTSNLSCWSTWMRLPSLLVLFGFSSNHWVSQQTMKEQVKACDAWKVRKRSTYGRTDEEQTHSWLAQFD